MQALLEQIDVRNGDAVFRGNRAGELNVSLLGDVCCGGRDGEVIGQISKYDIDRAQGTALVHVLLRDASAVEMAAKGVLNTLTLTIDGRAYLTDVPVRDNSTFKVCTNEGTLTKSFRDARALAAQQLRELFNPMTPFRKDFQMRLRRELDGRRLNKNFETIALDQIADAVLGRR